MMSGIISGGRRVAKPVCYAFIDNAYLRKQYDETMARVLGVAELAPKPLYLGSPNRTFVYDCMDVPRDSDTKENYERRTTAQSSYFDGLRALPGHHLRLGTLTTGRHPRQKQVDVHLAVDMLMHAHNRNMERAVLVAGDQDFKPVVDALVLMGVYVVVCASKRTVSRVLRQAADEFWPLEFPALYDLSSDRFQQAYPQPQARFDGEMPHFFEITEVQELGQHTITLGRAQVNSEKVSQIAITNVEPNPTHVLTIQHQNIDIAVRWVKEMFSIDLAR